MRDPQKVKEQNCGNCDFSALDIDEDTKTAILSCRKRCPRPEAIYLQDGVEVDIEYGAVQIDEWCGEWEKGIPLTAEQVKLLEAEVAATAKGGKGK